MAELLRIMEIVLEDDEMQQVADTRPLARREIENDEFGVELLQDVLKPTWHGDYEWKNQLGKETKADIRKAIKMFKADELDRVDFLCYTWHTI